MPRKRRATPFSDGPFRSVPFVRLTRRTPPPLCPEPNRSRNVTRKNDAHRPVSPVGLLRLTRRPPHPSSSSHSHHSFLLPLPGLHPTTVVLNKKKTLFTILFSTAFENCPLPKTNPQTENYVNPTHSINDVQR